MHYFQFNIKSYHADTVHLSNEEDICYRRLLDMYYDTEQPIPTANPPLTRRLRVGLPELESVLKEFFVLTERGWENAHCEHVIAEYNKFIDRQKANGRKGGKPKKTQALPTANPPLTQALANNKQETINNKLDLESLAIGKPNCPHEEIIKLYHEILPTLPAIKSWTNARKSKLKARWCEDVARQNLEYWEKYFKYVSTCKFLMGKNDRNWTASLDFLVTESKFVKVIEGEYEFAN